MTHTSPTGLFSDLGIAANFLSILTRKGFEVPTPIQHQIIPAALEGNDVVGIAQTGTGKTLAFGIPLIQRIAVHKGQGLILVPTRELALQVEQSLSNVGKPLGLFCAVIIGGTAIGPQIKALRRSPHVVIATPGRLVDLMDQGEYTLERVHAIVLDEADRMLDIGFLKQIRRIIGEAPKDRQIMLFSATMPKTISQLATEFMHMPLRIEVAPQGTSAESVEQEIFVVPNADKTRLLQTILEQYRSDTVLVFSRTKHGAKRIARDIRAMGHTACEIHSNRSQSQRQKALEGFINKTCRVMVATDIAARGIDVQHITLVINFDLPDCSEDYVHRIGRTGRAGRSGKAISFVTPAQTADVKKIERLIRKPLPVSALPQLGAGVARSAVSHERSARRGDGLKRAHGASASRSFAKPQERRGHGSGRPRHARGRGQRART